MNRLLVTALVLVLLGGVAALTLRIESDARSLFGLDDTPIAAIDTPQGRSITVAVVHPDRDVRSRIAAEMATALARNARIARLDSGPKALPGPLIGWLWRHRFRLAPPEPDDLTRAAMADELRAARASMASSAGFVLGDRQLRDPSGSFRRLIGRAGSAQRLRQHRGIWQSRDGTAALLFLTEVDAPFTASQTAALVQSVRGAFEAAIPEEARLLLLGPRAITARISAEIQRGATWTGLISLAGLLAWLTWAVQGWRGLAVCLLPLCVGFAGAALAVQVLFGSVHVIALGFGGALVGLALDYPLHLLGHRAMGGDGRRTGRLVLVAAATTACSFLALVGSSLPGLMQIGTFVATGLTIAGAVSLWVVAAEPVRRIRAPEFVRLVWRMPAKTAVLLMVVIVAGGALSQLPVMERDLTRMVAVPEQIRGELAELGAMVAPPDARYLVVLEGSDAEAVLQAGEVLAPVLEGAVGAGVLGGFTMIGSYLPSQARQGQQHELLPAVADLAPILRAAVRDAGLKTEFTDVMLAEYSKAQAAPLLDFEALERFPEFAPLTGLLQAELDGAEGIVLLTDVADPAALAQAVDRIGDGTIRFLDVNAELRAQLGAYRDAALQWFAIGAAAALAILWIALGRLRPVLELSASIAAAVSVSVLLLVLWGDALGVFQIVALTLVVGIGIDYGLFMNTAATPDEVRMSARSVGLCAVSTLIAFTIMAFSPIDLLSEIGLTVALGVGCILLVSFARSAPPRGQGIQNR